MDGMGGGFGPGPVPGLPGDVVNKIKDIQKQLDELRQGLELPVGPDPVDDYYQPPWRKPVMDDDVEAVRRLLDRNRGLPFPRHLRIAGVEATQSTQFFFFNNVGSNAAYDNSVPLIAGKDLLLRVYVDCDMGAGLNRITGEVRIGSKKLGPVNGPLWPGQGAAIRRDRINDTLNFRIPRTDCYGTRIFNVRVFDSVSPGFFNTSGNFRLELDFHDIQNVRVYGVMINFTGNNLNLAAPSGLRLVDTLARFAPMFPFPGFDFGPCVVRTFNNNLSTRAGWDAMLNEVANIRDTSIKESGAKGIYVGLLPPNTSGQVGTSTRGIGRYGVLISQEDDTRAMGHEFGHGLGLDHVSACGEGDTIDTKYPTYGSYMQASIGEVGVNLARMETHQPNSDWDFMTYCDNPNVLFPPDSWISPYNYLKIMNTARKTEGMTSGFKARAALATRMVLNLRVYRGGKVELLPSYKVVTTREEYDPRPSMPVVLDIFNRDGALVESHACHVQNMCGGGEDLAYMDVHEVIDWPEDVDRLVVARDRQEIATFEVGESHLHLEVQPLRRHEGEAGAGQVGIIWESGESREMVRYLVRYTADGGETWQTLAAGLEGNRFMADLETLPGGERCQFEVVAASGLHSVSAYSEVFEARRKPRQVYISQPQDNASFHLGEVVTFAGGGYSPDYGMGSADEIFWSSNIDGHLGNGQYFSREDLSPGKHRITLTVRDGEGGEAAASVYISISEQRVEPCEPHGD